MLVSVRDDPSGASVLALHGQLDIDTGPVLRSTLDAVLDRPSPRVVLDLTDLRFCDSTGLSALLLAHRLADGVGGWLRLAGPNPFLRRVLVTVGLTDRLDIYPDVAAALRST